MPPPALYIHVPFCRQRCRYCAFTSRVHDPAAAERYLDALEREFAARAAGTTFLTAYLGGGTPTVLAGAPFARLLRLVGTVKIDATPATWTRAAAFDLARPPGPPAGVEFGCEANPGTADAARLADLRGAGITRLSLGAQTFADAGLRVLGRVHDARAARTAYNAARKAGFVNVNLDLLHGWPGQTDADWRRDLEEVVRLGPEHVSCYALSVEPDTPWAADVDAGRLPPPDEEALRRGWDLAGEILETAGYRRYEVSNFARPGHETRHHVNYWTGGEYRGLGPGAHSHWDGRRFANTDDVDAYAAAWTDGGRPDAAETFSERLGPEAKARETLVAWLRLADGVPEAGFRRRTGWSWRTLAAAALPRLEAMGGVAVAGDRLRLTPVAWPVADVVLSELVGASEDSGI